MNYSEAYKKFFGLEKFGINLGLERIRILLSKLGNPQNDLKFIHIAGTNGKGSTSTMLANILSHSGYKTGLYTSPSVLCFRDYMQVDGEMISEEEFGMCAKEVCKYINFEDERERPTFFELKTATAFLWFKLKKCDIVCLEVGMGGEYDATNVILPPIMQIITSVSLDHTDVLGNTVEEIAHTKAKIIKGGVTVSYPKQAKSVLEVLEKRCKEVNSKLIIPELDELEVSDKDWQEDTFCYKKVVYKKSLYGNFQVYNAITVLTAAKAMQELGYNVTDDDIFYGLENSYICARMEVLSKKPMIILDGSHNPDGIEALKISLSRMKDTEITIIMGVLKDKGYNNMLKNICPLVKHFIAVTPDNKRALESKDLAEAAKGLCDDIKYFEDKNNAIKQVVSKLKANETLIVCGSLYLASELRPMLIEQIQLKTKSN